jgi:hypothetical protein
MGEGFPDVRLFIRHQAGNFNKDFRPFDVEGHSLDGFIYRFCDKQLFDTALLGVGKLVRMAAGR